jgi:hypothetical protein
MMLQGVTLPGSQSQRGLGLLELQQAGKALSKNLFYVTGTGFHGHRGLLQ